jgi:hypothetical protein
MYNIVLIGGSFSGRIGWEDYSMEKHLIELYQARMESIRYDFRKRYRLGESVKRKALKVLLRSRQQGLCYFCGGDLEHEDEAIRHIISVKHCSIAADSDRQADKLANDVANLALVHLNPCNSWVGSEDMTCGIEGDLENILAAMRKFNRGE